MPCCNVDTLQLAPSKKRETQNMNFKILSLITILFSTISFAEDNQEKKSRFVKKLNLTQTQSINLFRMNAIAEIHCPLNEGKKPIGASASFKFFDCGKKDKLLSEIDEKFAEESLGSIIKRTPSNTIAEELAAGKTTFTESELIKRKDYRILSDDQGNTTAIVFDHAIFSYIYVDSF